MIILRGLGIGCLLVILLLFAAAAAFFARYQFWPVHELNLALPEDLGLARVQVWGNTSSEGRFELLVEAQDGSVREVMWEDWGPAQRVSLYLTPERRLVAIGGGMVAAAVTLAEGVPRQLMPADLHRMNSERWRYLGAVDRAPGGEGLRFYSPAEQRECNATFSASSIRVRAAAARETCTGAILR